MRPSAKYKTPVIYGLSFLGYEIKIQFRLSQKTSRQVSYDRGILPAVWDEWYGPRECGCKSDKGPEVNWLKPDHPVLADSAEDSGFSSLRNTLIIDNSVLQEVWIRFYLKSFSEP